MNKKVGEGLVGSQFILSIHAESLKTVSDAEIIAVMSPTKGNAKKFASKHDIPHHFINLDEMLDIKEIDMIVIGAPNSVHCVMNDKKPEVTGEDGRAVFEVIFATYESAGTHKKVFMPFKSDVDKPYKLWGKRN